MPVVNPEDAAELRRLADVIDAGEEAYKLRLALWQKLDAEGVSRNEVAEWSGVSPVTVRQLLLRARAKTGT
jgi:hypothetical protein